MIFSRILGAFMVIALIPFIILHVLITFITLNVVVICDKLLYEDHKSFIQTDLQSHWNNIF